MNKEKIKKTLLEKLKWWAFLLLGFVIGWTISVYLSYATTWSQGLIWKLFFLEGNQLFMSWSLAFKDSAIPQGKILWLTGTLNTKANTTDVNAVLSNKVDNTTTVNGKQLNTNIALNKSDVGLSEVENTSDINKPISTLTQAALDTKLGKTEPANTLRAGATIDNVKTSTPGAGAPGTSVANLDRVNNNFQAKSAASTPVVYSFTIGSACKCSNATPGNTLTACPVFTNLTVNEYLSSTNTCWCRAEREAGERWTTYEPYGTPPTKLCVYR